MKLIAQVTIAHVRRMPKGAIRKWSHSPGSPLFMLHDPAPLILNGKDMGNPRISLDLTMKNVDFSLSKIGIRLSKTGIYQQTL
jgi:hypothetical protein